MCWKETCVVDERTRFIVDWQRGIGSMAALCEAYGISRKSGYKWRDRFVAGGFGELQDRSRARHELGHGNLIHGATVDVRAEPYSDERVHQLRR